ncbi:MAG: acetyl-CoA carboxylase biotin carboxyl carrier protein subunit [Alphaproteobacteria bacterium]|nr:MAG: acetyl-CoA carboxylase biotin carboxyl carrier protein subunit [Alphaproteobacteria bacterium]
MAEVKILSEIPGKVISIEVGAGDSVDEDDALVILESMKMEIPVDSPADGTIVKILVAVDDMVEEGDEIAIIET